MGASSEQNEQTLIENLKADFRLYRLKMKSRITNSYIKIGIGIVIVIGLIALSYLNADMYSVIASLKERLEFAGPLMGVPTTFTFASFNETKALKKKIEGIYDFEDRVAEWEKGITEFEKKDILTLEHEFERYIR